MLFNYTRMKRICFNLKQLYLYIHVENNKIFNDEKMNRFRRYHI